MAVQLTTVLPVGLLLCYCLQSGLFLLYNFKLHPWVKIIQETESKVPLKEEEDQREKIEPELKQDMFVSNAPMVDNDKDEIDAQHSKTKE